MRCRCSVSCYIGANAACVGCGLVRRAATRFCTSPRDIEVNFWLDLNSPMIDCTEWQRRWYEGARARPCFGECSHARNEAARAWVGSPDVDLTATEPTNASRSGGWKSEATKHAPKMIFISPQIVHKKFANDRC